MCLLKVEFKGKVAVDGASLTVNGGTNHVSAFISFAQEQARGIGRNAAADPKPMLARKSFEFVRESFNLHGVSLDPRQVRPEHLSELSRLLDRVVIDGTSVVKLVRRNLTDVERGREEVSPKFFFRKEATHIMDSAVRRPDTSMPDYVAFHEANHRPAETLVECHREGVAFSFKEDATKQVVQHLVVFGFCSSFRRIVGISRLQNE